MEASGNRQAITELLALTYRKKDVPKMDLQDIAEMFHLSALIAMKFAFHNLKDSDHQMRNRTIKALIALEVLNYQYYFATMSSSAN
uniref:Uncharacterized protein n=1 Tax=Solanum tuberosum TaxID=4113 RepID=M1DE37_SOLTU